MKKILSIFFIVSVLFGVLVFPIHAAENEILPTDEKLQWIGRTVNTIEGVGVGWGMTEVDLTVKASNVKVKISTTLESPDAPYFAVYINNEFSKKFKVEKGSNIYTIAENLDRNAATNIRLVKTNEVWMTAVIEKFEIDGTLEKNKSPKTRVIEVIGDSISAGYGILSEKDDKNNDINTDATYGYAIKLADKMGAQLNLIAQSGKGIYINNDGKTVDTMPTIYDKQVPSISNLPNENSKVNVDMVLINLGTNDAFQAPPTNRVSEAIKTFISNLLEEHPKAQIVWSYGLMNNNLTTTIKNAVENHPLNDGRVHFIELPNQKSFSTKATALQSHPNTETNEKLADYIYNQLKLKGILDKIENSQNEDENIISNNTSSSKKSYTKLIIFGVVGIAELLIIIIITVWFIKKKKIK